MMSRIPDFDDVQILVVGDVMLDRYWRGDTSRISPEAPVPVVRVDGMDERPGGAANVALNLAALGVKPVLIGLTGDDQAADTLEQCLEAVGVECRFERTAGVPTITKLRILSSHQQLIRLDFETEFPQSAAEALVERAKAILDQMGTVICSDYAKGSLTAVPKLIQKARAAGCQVLVDPKGKDFRKYRGATVITPNLAEFEEVVGQCPDEPTLVARGSDLVKNLEVDALLVTRGERGMTLLREGLPEFHLPARAQDVFDVTGAGDTVIAMFGATLAAGESQQVAATLANLAAGCVVAKLGTAVVTPAELRRALMREDAGSGVVGEEQLAVVVADARAHGERIVMTNGCFDILHAGHIAYLAAARRLGDRLVVAVNDDASVKRLKGAERPVNTLEHRMALLAALECVDWIVPFSESTPERLICRIAPDVLVKGGDYRPEDIAGYSCVVTAGGEVRVLDYEHGLSTTRIINRIRTANADG